MATPSTYLRSPQYDNIALAIIETADDQDEATRRIAAELPPNVWLSRYVWEEYYQLPE